MRSARRMYRRPARRLLFLDRDGTIIRDIPYLHDPSRVELLPGVGEGLAAIRDLGLRLVIVTNQQGIGLGYYGREDFVAVNRAMARLLRRFGLKLSGVYFCPHSRNDRCLCRKPGTLLLERALRHERADARDCYLIGDKASDVEAGETVGCTSILIGNEVRAKCSYQAASFPDAVNWIRQRERVAREARIPC